MSAAGVLAIVMELIGGPYDGNTLTALTLWADSEGTPDSWNNPLATTEPGFGGYDVNSAGVKAYPSEQAGAEATKATLDYGAYSAVVRAIRDNASWYSIWSAVNQSPWCGGCQGGRYPIALYDALGREGHIPPPPRPSPPGPPSPPYERPQPVNKSVTAAWANLGQQTGPGINKLIDTFHTLR